MYTERKLSRGRYWVAASILTATAMLIGVGLLHLLPAAAGSLNSDSYDLAMPLRTRRGFIGIPDASTFIVQNIAPETAQITVTIALPDGSVNEAFVQTLSPESSYMFSDDEGLAILARIEPEPDLLTYTFGVNFELADLGNDAYLGLKWDEDPVLPPPEPEPYYLSIPLLIKDWFSTSFILQNRSADIDATIAVDFYDQSGVIRHSEYALIPANGAVKFDLAEVGELPNGYIGSATIHADTPIAVASVRTYADSLGLRSAYQGRGSWETSNVLIVPALFKVHDLQTSELCIQNIGQKSTNVYVSYSDGLESTAPIPAYGVHCFDQGAEGHTADWSGGAIISSTERLLATVNVMAYSGAPVGRWSYSVPNLEMITRTLTFPFLYTDYEGWTSEIHLYNYNDVPAQVMPRYVSYPSGFIYCADAFTMPAHSTLSISQAGLPGFFDQSMAYFIATQPVAAAVSFTSDEPLGSTDRHFGYSAAYSDGSITFPDTCDTIRKVFLPLLLKAFQ